MNQLINWLNVYFGQKAPKMPEGLKSFLIQAAPWLAIVGLVFSLPAALVLLGFSRFTMGYGMYVGNYQMFSIFSIAIVVLYALAIPGLFKKTLAGWNFTFYALLVSLIQSLVMMNIGSLIIGGLIGFWILFQIRPAYTGVTTPPPPTTPV
ncbi:MAG: hypothetical protein AAB787_01095 [Patescibacteria group bacterium]